jgi:methyl-accepting chemotaxis protein
MPLGVRRLRFQVAITEKPFMSYRFSHLPLAAKIATVLALLLLVSLTVASVSWRNLRTIEETGRWDLHTRDVFETVDRLVMAMVNRETGLRGYLLSGQASFLDPYRMGEADFAAALERVRSLTADNPAQQGRLDALKGLEQSWTGDIATRAIRLMGEPATQAEARRIETSGAGKAAMDGLRAKAAEIAAIERDLLARRSGASAEAITQSRLASIVGFGVMVVAAAGSLLLLHLGVAKPIRGMTGTMGRLARNDLAAKVPGIGRRDEIGDMAAALQVFKESMVRARALEEETALARASAEEQRRAGMRQMADAFEAAVGGIVGMVSASATELQATAQQMTAFTAVDQIQHTS